MKTKKTLFFILMYIPLVVALVALQYLPDTIPAHYGFDKLVFGIVGILMIVTGNIMPKLQMNSIIGLRTHWSMKNEVI